MNTFSIADESLKGVYLIECPYYGDERGNFIKRYHSDLFNSLGLSFTPKECFHSDSCKNVIRGMHYQVGEYAHDKYVYCTSGSILDVVVDIRKGSDTYGVVQTYELNESSSYSLYISKGFAHGYLVLSSSATVHYMTSTVHSPAHDAGILWSSIDFNWPITSPILSIRDQNHPLICDI